MSKWEYRRYDLLGLKIGTIISFYSVCCICIAINVVYSSHHIQEKKKKAKHEDVEREARIKNYR